jgi:hypothetical protein
MSYGARGAPKGYSNPRGVDTTAAQVTPLCQKCDQSGHWSFECKATTTTYASRPSRTQLLRRGLKIAPQEVVVAGASERDQFESELKVRAALLEEELRREAGLPAHGTDSAAIPPSKIEESDCDSTAVEVKVEMKLEPLPLNSDAPIIKRHRSESAAGEERASEQAALDKL